MDQLHLYSLNRQLELFRKCEMDMKAVEKVNNFRITLSYTYGLNSAIVARALDATSSLNFLVNSRKFSS